MAARKKQPKSPDTQSQSDPKAPLDSAALLKAATSVLKALAADLLARADGSPSITKSLQARHEKERAAERTADNYDTWRRDFVEQVAAAWFLSCVFVRTLEDRGLIDRNRLAGPGAEDSQKAFFALAPSLNERDYLLTVFRELQQLPAAKELFDARHNPVWLLGPSAQAAKDLLALFREPQADAPSFRFGNADSRFLGDLYQDLSENVRKRYALLQTPRFVERFILDRTLEPAIERFGLNDTNLIDPTCGSGHFLLGAFERLLEHRQRSEPGLDVRQAALKALDAVAGSDVNPYAVAVAKFRLTLAFLEKAGYQRLKEAPKLPLHVVVADSLLHNPYARGQQSLGDIMTASVEVWKGAEFKLEDESGAKEVLYKRYAAVVGNPPYITVKDKVLRDRYRAIYKTAFREYSLAVPFKERFFQLAKPRAYVGMITANSFMKREFGSKVIEEYLPTVNLETIVNTSGAYIPGHGTPTVMLFGTAEKPQKDTVLTVLASRGEPSTPDDPERGHVWSSIVKHWNEVGFNNEYITVARTDRVNLATHPWSLGGGGASELKMLLEERAQRRLSDVVDSIGFMCITKQDDVFAQPRGVFARHRLGAAVIRQIVAGEHVRDWAINSDCDVLYPYGPQAACLKFSPDSPEMQFLWPLRTVLECRAVFGGQTFRDAGKLWYEYGQIPADRQEGNVIAFAEVATHNHFVLDRGGKVFNRTAPIIKLPKDATEDDHYALLAYLNSSTAAFYIRQVAQCKGAQGVNEGHKSEIWEQFIQRSGTAVGTLPLPRNLQLLASLGRAMESSVAEFLEVLPAARLLKWATEPETEVPSDFGTPPRDMLQRLVALQEEIDWAVYRLFGLLDKTAATEDESLLGQLFPKRFQIDPRHDSPSCAELAPGHRPFEQLLDSSSTQWFRRNLYSEPGSIEMYSGGMSALIRHRMEIIRSVHEVQVIEQPEYKYRWTVRNIESEAMSAAASWVTSALETQLHEANPRMLPALVLDWLKVGGHRATAVVTHYLGGDALAWVREAVASDATPFLSAYRFTESGLEKYAAWEETWANQRREDAGEPNVTCAVPPKYAQEDFRDANYWRLRGKLDVPKERFISYPGCESDEDHEPVYGWAGWNHLQRAQALAQLYNARREEGWADEVEQVEADGKTKQIRAPRLIPMLAGILELLPWLLQWHNEPSDDLGGQRAGEQFSLFLESQCAELGVTHEDLRNWRPRAKRGRGK